jgi:hypothetical protein
MVVLCRKEKRSKKKRNRKKKKEIISLPIAVYAHTIRTYYLFFFEMNLQYFHIKIIHLFIYIKKKKKNEGHEEMARVLVEELHHPVEVEEDKHGFTPVFAAAQKGHVSVLEVLHKAKAKLDVVAKPGLTPLMVAAQQGQAKVVEWLADHGCKLDSTLPSGATAMFLAGISLVLFFMLC